MTAMTAQLVDMDGNQVTKSTGIVLDGIRYPVVQHAPGGSVSAYERIVTTLALAGYTLDGNHDGIGAYGEVSVVKVTNDSARRAVRTVGLRRFLDSQARSRPLRIVAVDTSGFGLGSYSCTPTSAIHYLADTRTHGKTRIGAMYIFQADVCIAVVLMPTTHGNANGLIPASVDPGTMVVTLGRTIGSHPNIVDIRAVGEDGEVVPYGILRDQELSCFHCRELATATAIAEAAGLVWDDLFPPFREEILSIARRAISEVDEILE